MLVNRAGRACAAGDLQVPDRRRHRQGRRADLLPLALAAGAATLVQAATSFAPLAGPRRRRAARHHRMRRRVQAHVAAPAGPLLRLDQDRRADLARHDRRRGHPEPGRHRPGAARRRRRHRRRSRSACSSTSTGSSPLVTLGRARRCSAARWRARSSGCGRSSASAARSTPRSPAGWPSRSAASASSRPTPPRGARSWSSRSGAHRLFRNVAKTMTGVSAVTRVLDRRRRRHRRRS